MTIKVALITSITSQDGAYLTSFSSRRCIVHWHQTPCLLFNTDRIDHLYRDPMSKNKNFILHCSDLTDSTIIRIIQGKSSPTNQYNLATMSQVAVSFETRNTLLMPWNDTCAFSSDPHPWHERKTRFYQTKAPA